MTSMVDSALTGTAWDFYKLLQDVKIIDRQLYDRHKTGQACYDVM